MSKFVLLERLKDANFWEEVKDYDRFKFMLDDMLSVYEEQKGKEITKSMEKWCWDAAKAKDPTTYDDIYFVKRSIAIKIAMLALIYPDNSEYLKRLEEYLQSICEEYAWAVPTHCISTDDDSTMVDLYASETAAMLAEIVTLFEDRLDKNLVDLIKREVERRVFIPFHNTVYPWEYELLNNWTTVCCGHIGIALMHLAPERFEQEKDRIIADIGKFINEFPDDGGCLEGIGYFNYGVGSWVLFADALSKYTNGEIDLFNDKKSEIIASYVQKTFMKGDIVASFADGGETAKISPSYYNLLCEKYPNTYRKVPKKYVADYGRGRVSWSFYTRTLLYGLKPMYDEDFHRENSFLASSGQCFINEEDYSLFIKAGFNAESHNHNDVGSFILSTKLGQIFCDLGSATYFIGYFDNAIRYTMFTTTSKGHNLPIIDGKYQQYGKQYRGEIWKDGNCVSMDFAKAYDDVKKCIRKFTYSESSVEMTDEFDGNSDITERFIARFQPESSEDGIKVGNVLLIAEGVKPKITPFKNKEITGNPLIYLIDYDLGKVKTVTFKMIIER